MRKTKSFIYPTILILIMGTKDAPEKGEGNKGDAYFGRVNPEKMEATFPTTLDRHGKMVVPDYVRVKLGISGKKAVVSVSMAVREVFD